MTRRSGQRAVSCKANAKHMCAAGCTRPHLFIERASQRNTFRGAKAGRGIIGGRRGFGRAALQLELHSRSNQACQCLRRCRWRSATGRAAVAAGRRHAAAQGGTTRPLQRASFQQALFHIWPRRGRGQHQRAAEVLPPPSELWACRTGRCRRAARLQRHRTPR